MTTLKLVRGLRSILRMRVEREEEYVISIESKTSHHQLFDKWAGWIMVDSDMKKLFNQLGINNALLGAKSISVDRNRP